MQFEDPWDEIAHLEQEYDRWELERPTFAHFLATRIIATCQEAIEFGDEPEEAKRVMRFWQLMLKTPPEPPIGPPTHRAPRPRGFPFHLQNRQSILYSIW